MKALFFFAIFLSSLFAQDIDIKGLKIGMTFEEASKLFKFIQYDKKSFARVQDVTTFGGVNINFMSVNFENDKVRDILITMKPDNFDTVIDALKEKYKMTCVYSTIQNRMGAKFNQEKCNYIYNGVVLMADKYMNKTTESSIFVSNLPSDEDMKNEKEKAKNDI